MSRLKLITRTSDARGCPAPSPTSPEGKRSLEDHLGLVEGYLLSHRIRNHSENTIDKERRILESWFQQQGTPSQLLYTWEAMAPIAGRKRIVEYGKTLIALGIRSSTIRRYLGILSRYFSYVLEHPYLFTEGQHHRIQDRYGPIDQPVSEYDIPVHSREEDPIGTPIDPERLYEFYSILRQTYLQGGHPERKARNYTLAVLAGETGLRINEIIHLEVQDLFFESHKIQTRWGKASRGSGHRVRLTLFPPLARDTVRFYLNTYRSKSRLGSETPLLFFSRSGNPLDYPTLQKALKEMIRCAQGADFPVSSRLSWHSYRRIFATLFIERFPNQLSVLIQLLGHSSPNTVHSYIRHSEAWMNKQIQSVLEGSAKWPSIGT